MKKSNVIDFFSKKTYSEIASKDWQKNDKMTNQFGIYLGCFGGNDTKIIRNLSDELNMKRIQIEQLTAEWEQLHEQYNEALHRCLAYLNIPKQIHINFENDSIMVSVNGDVWVIHDYEEKVRAHQE
ncbi:hypothetical protein [Lysinibacillus sp. BW-2-10]|uniref:hypothetical protein n=1 Tax=Lysinibacillus sp. BW-2-10 TaxID=2590030 RepID=UPI00117DCE86|nr:hypothetical protein [Lysinibacillus sp. BW-2-10]TSI05122.1 hypothetical protein FJQ64_12455 [Lysinibacillus sp. BW-2-10]